jgi:HD-GYP domain-containing protein (c-di-GMP phosphodiesterase class II)
LFLRAVRTFRLTQRLNDLLVAVGIVWLGAALVPALVQDYTDLGWWLGHGFELVGITLVGGAVAFDLYRGSGMSRPLVGDLRAVELVRQEEAFLGSHVRALLVSLADKDASTEEHTRRVALRAVEVGEELGLPAPRLRGLALGGLLHDMGKLAVPADVLSKPGSLSDEEFAIVKRHPQAGVRLLRDLGGFPDAALGLVRGHHERLDGSGYPDGVSGDALDLDTRILAVCDVYDALVSPRVYREAWSHERALALLRDDSQFDQRCVEALERIVGRERSAGLAVAV